MKDYLYIGSSPPEEECAQVGSNNYHSQAIKECLAYIGQLRRVFGWEPKGAKLKVKEFAHDFGSYHDVVCYYDDDLPESVEYAFKIEGNSVVENWDKQALKELA